MKRKIAFLLFSMLICSVFSVATTSFADGINYTPATIEIDKTYIERAVVSTTPIDLVAEVRNSERQKLWSAEVEYSVISGESVAEVVDGKLTVKSAGNFTLRGVCKDNAAVSQQVDCVAYSVSFSNIEFNNRFESITVYTQPIKLMGSIDIEGMVAPTDCHYELVYEVLSGPAEIYLGEFLRITGTGKVVVQAASRYDSSVKTTAEFTVTDPDAGKDLQPGEGMTQGDISDGAKKGGCSGAAAFSSVFALAAFALCGLTLKKKHK